MYLKLFFITIRNTKPNRNYGSSKKGKIHRQPMKRNMTDASKDALIAAKNNRIKKLEEENKCLKDELLKLRGMIYDKF